MVSRRHPYTTMDKTLSKGRYERAGFVYRCKWGWGKIHEIWDDIDAWMFRNYFWMKAYTISNCVILTGLLVMVQHVLARDYHVLNVSLFQYLMTGECLIK